MADDGPFNPAAGLARTRLDLGVTDVDRQARADVLVLDMRRQRPSYFDGRFLAAADLLRDQSYVLTRQADLSRAGGAGIVNGLDVRPSGTSALAVTAGTGVTPAGELVVLPQDRVFNIAALPAPDQLNIGVDLLQPPAAPVASRSGTYVLAIRPVQYNDGSATRYPLTVNGSRGTSTADVVDAVSLLLVPYLGAPAERDPFQKRSELARRIFLEGARDGLSAELLPLAMVEIDQTTVRWVDVDLVRREVAVERAGGIDLGGPARALRQAHRQQYEAQLDELVTGRGPAGNLNFVAADLFRLLPAAGRLPAGRIDAQAFTQRFFPPEMEVILSVIADDELPALVEESLALPPIDLTGQAEDFDFTRILVLAPLPRATLRTLRLEDIARVDPFVPTLPSKRLPVDILNTINGAVPAQALVTRPAASAIVLGKLSGGAIIRAAATPVATRGPSAVGASGAVQAGELALMSSLVRKSVWRQALRLVQDGELWYVRARANALRTEILFPPGEKQEQKDTKDQSDAKTSGDVKNAADTKIANDAKAAADTKLLTDGKNARDTKNTKDRKDNTDTKNNTDAKTIRDQKDQADTKNTKDSKDNKDSPDKTTTDNAKNQKDTKNATDAKNEQDTKNNTDGKTVRDKAAKDTKVTARDKTTISDIKLADIKATNEAKGASEVKVSADVKVTEIGTILTGGVVAATRKAVGPAGPLATFIRSAERPPVGEGPLADAPGDDDEDDSGGGGSGSGGAGTGGAGGKGGAARKSRKR